MPGGRPIDVVRDGALDAGRVCHGDIRRRARAAACEFGKEAVHPRVEAIGERLLPLDADRVDNMERLGHPVAMVYVRDPAADKCQEDDHGCDHLPAADQRGEHDHAGQN